MDSVPKYSVRLSESEREALSQFDHALDYQFSDAELSFLEENGYVVLRNIIDTETIDRLVQEALSQIRKAGVNPNDSGTWSGVPFHGCFDVWNTRTYNEIRQNPLLYSVFAQLLKTGNLTVSVDRINLKPPCLNEEEQIRRNHANINLELHTDLNYWTSDANRPLYQGGLCLQDCPVGGGGFFCIPGFHRPERVQRYMNEVQRGKFRRPRPIDGKAFCVYFDQADADANKVEVPLQKGDYVVWNNNLPHNGGKNALLLPENRQTNSLENFRMHAYIMYVPLDGPCVTPEIASFYATYQFETRNAILSGSPPVHYATRNRTGKKLEKIGKAASIDTLTPLGERLLGLVSWAEREEREEQ